MKLKKYTKYFIIDIDTEEVLHYFYKELTSFSKGGFIENSNGRYEFVRKTGPRYNEGEKEKNELWLAELLKKREGMTVFQELDSRIDDKIADCCYWEFYNVYFKKQETK